jgi:tetratricopeptide (TPR) repeat protein
MNNTLIKYFTFITIITLNTFCTNHKEKETEQFLLRGNVELKKREYEKAIKFYDEAIEKTADYAPAYNNRGLAKVQLGDLSNAIEDFKKAVELEPNFFEAIYNLGNYQGESGNYENALKTLKKVEKEYKEWSFFHVSMGFINANQNRTGEAYSNFQKAIFLNPKNDKAFANLGFVQVQERKFEDAKVSFEKAISINPINDLALNNLAFIYSREENYQKALELINRALDQKPAEPIFQNNKGFILLNLNQLEEGKSLIENSINQSKTPNAWAYRNLGIYYLQKNEILKAKENFIKSEEIDPSVEWIYYYLALTSIKQNDKKSACKYIEIGKKLGDTKAEKLNC